MQFLAIEFEEERPRKDEYDVGILEVDVNPILNKHHSRWRQAVLRKAYNVAFRMKGVHNDILYLPEIDLQKGSLKAIFVMHLIAQIERVFID